MTWIEDSKRQAEDKVRIEKEQAELLKKQKEAEYRQQLGKSLDEIEHFMSIVRQQGVDVNAGDFVGVAHCWTGSFWAHPPYRAFVLRWELEHKGHKIQLEVGIDIDRTPILYIPSAGGGKIVKSLGDLEMEIKSWLGDIYERELRKKTTG